MIWIAGGVALFFSICYLLVVKWEAKRAINQAPRTDIMVCKHGPIPKEYCYTFKAEGILDEPILQCPLCLEEKFKEAKDRYKIKGV